MRGPDDLYLRLQAHKGRKHQALLVHTPQITWRGNKRRYHTHIRLDQKPISRYLIRISPTKRSDCSYSRPLLCTGEQQGAFGYTITWSRLLRGPDDLYLRLQAHRGIKHQALHVNTSQITWRNTKRWYHWDRKHQALLVHTPQSTCRGLSLKRSMLIYSTQNKCPCT